MEFKCASREMHLKLFLRLHRQPFVTAILYRRPVQSRKRNQLHLSIRTVLTVVGFAILRNILLLGALGAGSVENVPASYIPVISPHNSRFAVPLKCHCSIFFLFRVQSYFAVTWGDCGRCFHSWTSHADISCRT